MNILMLSIGTRGDMEPFLAIGDLLKEKGHRVICAFPYQFEELARDSGLEFISLGKGFVDLLNSREGRLAMGGSGSGLRKIIANIRLAGKSTAVNKELVLKQYEIIHSLKPDRIVYNSKAIYPIIWGVKNKGRNILLCPMPYMHYVKGHSHVAFHKNFGSFFNRLSFSLARFGMIMTVRISLKWLKYPGIISRRDIKKELLTNKAIYTLSPALFSKPPEWKGNLNVVGYQQKIYNTNWQASEELKGFLKKHKKILFISFGSMLNPEPEKKTKLFLDILERNRIPAIINTAAGGLIKPDDYHCEHVFFVSSIPYHWILPKVYAVIHHGGSGTCHLALGYACPTMIIPHIIDQFVFNKIVSGKGLGPKGNPVNRLNKKNLEKKILDLYSNPSYKVRVKEIAAQMSKKDFKQLLYESILR